MSQEAYQYTDIVAHVLQNNGRMPALLLSNYYISYPIPYRAMQIYLF